MIYPNEIDIKIFGKDAYDKFKSIADMSMSNNKTNTFLPGVVELYSNDTYITDEYAIFSGYGDCSMECIFFNHNNITGAATLSEIASCIDADIIAVSFRESDDMYCIYEFSKEGKIIKHSLCSITEKIMSEYADIEDFQDAIVDLEDDIMTKLIDMTPDLGK